MMMMMMMMMMTMQSAINLDDPLVEWRAARDCRFANNVIDKFGASAVVIVFFFCFLLVVQYAGGVRDIASVWRRSVAATGVM